VLTPEQRRHATWKRLDGRVWATFVTSGGSLGCGTRGCWFGFGDNVLWQGEASAGVVVAF
jgi:hypothetical protein